MFSGRTAKRGLVPRHLIFRLTGTGKIAYFLWTHTDKFMKTRKDKFGNINQREIANELGVSQSLVSKILAGRNEASPEMTGKILRLVQEKGYRPNMLVRGVLSGKTKTIGVVIPADGFFSEIVHGIHDCLTRAGYAMFLVWNDDHMVAPDSKKELEYIHSLVDRRVDGIILRPTHDEVSQMYFNEVHLRGIPMVIVVREIAPAHYDFVGTDDRAGGELAAKHLLELGHRCLGQIAGPSIVSTSRGRRLGFESAVADFGPTASCLTIEAPGFSNAKTQILELLQSTPRPTAVFAANDDAAAEIYVIAASLGLRIPDDLSVIGFGDLVFAPHLTPPLTTLRQNPYSIGENAAALMLTKCASKHKKKPAPEVMNIKFLPTLVVRGSTCAVKQRSQSV